MISQKIVRNLKFYYPVVSQTIPFIPLFMLYKNSSITTFLFLLISLSNVNAQDSTVTAKSSKVKGTFYCAWGYNRDWYSKSTINFKNTTTDNYNFTFHDAHASDKPDFEGFYVLDKMTVPQYNMNVGYLFNDKHNLGIEVSWDHLKYVVNDYQSMRVTGQIRGRAIDKDTVVNPDFVHLQHTNGNNYLQANLVKKNSLVKGNNFEISVISRVGGGILMSYTISTVLQSYNSGHFAYQGYVLSASTGFRIDVLRYLFVQTYFQGAYAKYTDSKVGADNQGVVKHHFYSLFYTWQAGFNIPLQKRGR